MCAPPSNETIGSSWLVYPVPSKYDQKDILKCICNQKILRMDFILRMEILVLLQRNKLNSPDYRLTNIKDNIGRNSLLQSNIPPSTTFLAFTKVTYYRSRGFIFSMSTSFRLTSKSTTVICPSSDVAPIMIVAIMNSHTKRVTVSTDPTAGPSEPLSGMQERHQAPAQ